MIQLQEHDLLSTEYKAGYDNLSLIKWGKPADNAPWGYYASYKIGAEWVDGDEAVVVTTKRKLENIDFIAMFMACFNSGQASDSFSKIYSISMDEPPIKAPALRGVISPLIAVHFISVVSRIKSLKRGYVNHCGNLRKIKGRIKVLKNERKNIATKRYERIYCDYNEYSVDIPENRIIKRALLFAKQLLRKMASSAAVGSRLSLMLSKNLSLFSQVSSDVDIKEARGLKGHKLYSEYGEAIRLAKLILRHFDYSISKISEEEETVPPFVLDMSLLYEHYVYGLLHEAYSENIVYQYGGGITGYPDFLYCGTDFKAVLDTKYIPKYDVKVLDTGVIRQLGGYARDLPILKRLGFCGIDEESPVPDVPCIIIYPTEGAGVSNPFRGKALPELCVGRVGNLIRFYKIEIPLPVVCR